MSLTDKTIANTFKDILQMDNSNSGITTAPRVVKDGAGNQSALHIGDDYVLVRPENDDTVFAFQVQDKDSGVKFRVDTTNGLVQALGHNVTTQYAYFGMDASNHTSFSANTHYLVPFNNAGLKAGGSNVDFGTGTDPDDTFTTANTATQYAAQLVLGMWRVPDDITIDSVTHIEGAFGATGDTTRMHLKSFTFTSGSTSCLTAGALLAHNSDVTNDGNEQAYLSTWTVDSANVDANKVICCFWRADAANSDYSAQVIVKYHLR